MKIMMVILTVCSIVLADNCPICNATAYQFTGKTDTMGILLLKEYKCQMCSYKHLETKDFIPDSVAIKRGGTR